MHSQQQNLSGSGLDADLIGLFGFVPNLFRMQGEAPHLLDAQVRLLQATLGRSGDLSRARREAMISAVAAVHSNVYCQALFRSAHANQSGSDQALLTFVHKLARYARWVSFNDIQELQTRSFTDSAILEVVFTVAVAQLLCTVAEALRPDPDFPADSPSHIEIPAIARPSDWIEPAKPYLSAPAKAPADFLPLRTLQDQIGYVPSLFRIQMIRPDLVEAEVQALDLVLFSEDALNRVQKERVILNVSVANVNTYSVALHSQVMSALGVSAEECDQIVECQACLSISDEERGLLTETQKLALPYAASKDSFNVETLRKCGFRKPQILEAIVTAGFANLLNTLQSGLGAVPDFAPRRIFTSKDLYLSSAIPRPTSEREVLPDPDAPLVAEIKSGNADGFEELVRRHSSRVFRTLAGIVGNADDAHDATQDVFLRAFEKLDSFQGRSRFSTWLISIAINTGTEVLRRRKPVEAIDSSEDEDDFRPRRVQRWVEDPEELLSAAERDQLVREAILHLPEKYRVALILRDINQLPTEEAAAALELSVPALKARVLRARLMLRERLAPHFMGPEDA